MCTSIIHNGKKTIVGWNLDILNMQFKVETSEKGVYIMIYDQTEGWMPLFGANSNKDFVSMPTCWPYDNRSDPKEKECYQIIPLNIDLLLEKKNFSDIKKIVENNEIYSVKGITFQAQLTDSFGNVLQIIPGQGYKYLEKPKYSIMTNFSLFKGDTEIHPWMGMDRYNIGTKMLDAATDLFDVKDCFDILKETSQTICPTVVSMVFDVTNNIVYWCENRNWDEIKSKQLKK